MDTAVAAPPAAAPAAAAPSTPAPAAAAPVSSPAAPVVDAAKPTPEVGSPEFFAEALEKVPTEEPAAEAAKPEGEKPAVGEVKPAVEETTEAKAAREAAAAETPEAKATREAAEAEAAKKAAEPPPNQQEIDLGESIAPAELLSKIDAAPDAVKEWFNDPANPLKETLTTMARRAAIADPILREIPDAETAQRLVQTGAEYEAFDTAFDTIASPKDAVGWWQKMYQSQMTKDEQGNPVPHPAFTQLEVAITEANLGWMVDQAKQGQWHPRLTSLFHDSLDAKLAEVKKAIAAGQDVETNEDAALAIEALQRSSPRPNNKPPELTPEQKKAQEQINKDRAEIDGRKATEFKATVDNAFSTVTKDVDSAMADQFIPAIEKAGLVDKEFDHAVVDIATALEAELEKHPLYVQRKAQLKAAIAKNPSEQNIAALKKHELTYRNMKIGKVTKEVLRAAAKGPMARQEAKHEKVAAQVDASRAEPRGTSAAAPAVQAKGTSLAESQALWDAMPEAQRPKMDFIDYHMNRIMGAKK